MVFLDLQDDRSEKVRYNCADYPIYIRRSLLSSYSNYAAPMHWHDDIEFIAVLSGKMQYNVNGRMIAIKENEGIIVNARQIHFGFSTEKNECDFVCVLLHPMLLCATAAYERDFVLPLLHNRNAAFIKLNHDISWQKAIYESIRHMYLIKDEKAAPLKVQNLFSSIWIQLYETIPSESRLETQSADLSIVKNMIGFIQRSYAAKISLADIAASGAVGQSKCCKLFAKYVHQTPTAYLTQYRLDKSAALLKNTDGTIAEIAAAIGFGGSSYYAEAFRRWCGKSPTQYRKDIEKIGSSKTRRL